MVLIVVIAALGIACLDNMSMDHRARRADYRRRAKA